MRQSCMCATNKYHPWWAVLVLAGLVGCSLPPAARREIALLKNEILDLQTQYFALKSEYIRATGSEPQIDFLLPPSSKSPFAAPIDSNCEDIYLGQRNNGSASYRHLVVSANDQSFRPSEDAQLHSPDSEFRSPRLGRAGQEMAQADREVPCEQATFTKQPSAASTGILTPPSASNEYLDVTALSYWDEAGPNAPLKSKLRVIVRSPAGVMRATPVQVSLLDVCRATGEQRIGFWELTGDQVAALLDRGGDPTSMDLLLPWPREADNDGELRLFVRQRVGDLWVEGNAEVVIDPEFSD